MKQQKSTFFDKRIATKNRTTKDLNIEAIRLSKCNWGKSGTKFIEVTTNVSKFQNLLYFRQHGPNFRPFQKIYFNQKYHWLRM